MNWRTLGPAGAAALLLIAGAWRVQAAGAEGWPLFILGAVCFGAWLALHARGGDK